MFDDATGPRIIDKLKTRPRAGLNFFVEMNHRLCTIFVSMHVLHLDVSTGVTGIAQVVRRDDWSSPAFPDSV